MKKNIAMRIAAFLFILTMISTCAFATTFAKYTTSGSASDEARVAKWGVTVSAPSTIDLFKGQYQVKDNPRVTNGLAVEAVQDVVAPGTSGNLADFTVSGQPEVAVEVTYSAVLTLSGWDVNGAEEGEYCPIIFTINGVDVTGATMAQLKEKVEAAIAKASATYEANKSISDTLDVSWRWEFEADTLADYQTNEKDTALGNLDTAPTIKLVFNCIVTQIE